VEFSSGAYSISKAIAEPVTILSFTSGTGASGYLGTGSIVSGTGSAYAFNFQDKNYALFLSYTGSTANPTNMSLRYRVSAKNQVGNGIYIVPINDSLTGSIKMLSNDILITDE